MADHWGLWLLAAVVVTAPLTAVSAAPAGASGAVAQNTGAQTADTAVTTDPGGNITAQRWETLTVTVRANATDVTGYQSAVTYDPTVLQVKAIAGTDDFDAPVATIDNTNGSVVFNQVRSGETDDPALARLSVQVIGTGGARSDLSVAAGGTRFSDATGSTSDPDRTSGLTVAVEPGGASTDGAAPTDQSGLGVGGPAVLLVAVAIVGWIAVRNRGRIR